MSTTTVTTDIADGIISVLDNAPNFLAALPITFQDAAAWDHADDAGIPAVTMTLNEPTVERAGPATVTITTKIAGGTVTHEYIRRMPALFDPAEIRPIRTTTFQRFHAGLDDTRQEDLLTLALAGNEEAGHDLWLEFQMIVPAKDTGECAPKTWSSPRLVFAVIDR